MLLRLLQGMAKEGQSRLRGWGMPHTSGCAVAPPTLQYQDVQQLLQVAADDTLVLIECPAPLLRVILVPGQVSEDHLQPLLIMAYLP